MKIDEIRKLISTDSIDEAISQTQGIAPPSFSDSLILLSNRFQKWKRDNRNGFEPSLSLRNTIIGDLLDMLSEIENNSAPMSVATGDKKRPGESSPSTKQLMPEAPNQDTDDRKQIFISYAHKDQKSLAELKRHFKPLSKKVNFWDDSFIRPGMIWNNEIQKQLAKSDAAILLISADFFNSDFITNNELPPILESASAKGTSILSIILRPCLWEEFPEINRFQSVNAPDKPASSLSPSAREELWVNLVRAVKNVLKLS